MSYYITTLLLVLSVLLNAVLFMEVIYQKEVKKFWEFMAEYYKKNRGE